MSSGVYQMVVSVAQMPGIGEPATRKAPHARESRGKIVENCSRKSCGVLAGDLKRGAFVGCVWIGVVLAGNLK